jgi:hypothetical protein
MNKKIIITFIILIAGYILIVFGSNSKVNQTNNFNELWKVDFIDDFDTFNLENWQDQRIWVNNESQCYVPNGEYNTREVSPNVIISQYQAG